MFNWRGKSGCPWRTVGRVLRRARRTGEGECRDPRTLPIERPGPEGLDDQSCLPPSAPYSPRVGPRSRRGPPFRISHRGSVIRLVLGFENAVQPATWPGRMPRPDHGFVPFAAYTLLVGPSFRPSGLDREVLHRHGTRPAWRGGAPKGRGLHVCR